MFCIWTNKLDLILYKTSEFSEFTNSTVSSLLIILLSIVSTLDVIVGLDVLFLWRNSQVENACPTCGMIPALYRSEEKYQLSQKQRLLSLGK